MPRSASIGHSSVLPDSASLAHGRSVPRHCADCGMQSLRGVLAVRTCQHQQRADLVYQQLEGSDERERRPRRDHAPRRRLLRRLRPAEISKAPHGAVRDTPRPISFAIPADLS